VFVDVSEIARVKGVSVLQMAPVATTPISEIGSVTSLLLYAARTSGGILAYVRRLRRAG
jgi:hypothetical protein